LKISEIDMSDVNLGEISPKDDNETLELLMRKQRAEILEYISTNMREFLVAPEEIASVC
jgi:hypothetical protein